MCAGWGIVVECVFMDEDAEMGETGGLVSHDDRYVSRLPSFSLWCWEDQEIVVGMLEMVD